jgi:hypothetical protein
MTPIFNYTFTEANKAELEDIAIAYFQLTTEEILQAPKDALANIGLDIVNGSFKGDIVDAYIEIVEEGNIVAGEYEPRPFYMKFK